MLKKLLTQIVCLLAFGSLFLIGCRKDLTSPDQSARPITFRDAQKWVESNPVAQIVTLDWEKARNITDNGKGVINVPITGENRLALIRNSTHKAVLAPMVLGSTEARGNSPDNTESNPNFTPGHPPAILFVKDSTNKVKGYMYNFVAADKNKENGSDGLWTGKLYQWNMKSDTLLIMEFNKNQIVKRSLIAPRKKTSSESSFAKLATMRPDNQVGSIWSWLGNILSDIWDALNWIGYHLGIPGAYNNEIDEYRNWNLDWGAQETIQYTVATIDSGPYNSYLVSGGSGYGIPAMSAVDQLLLKLYIKNSAVAQYFENNGMVVSEMTNYLNVHGHSLENITFLAQIAEYLAANPTEDFNFIKEQYFGVNYDSDGDDPNATSAPVTTTSPQALPSWGAFAAAFPKITVPGVAQPQHMGSPQVYNLIGGSLATKHNNNISGYQNACALRGSRGLNYAGKLIPADPPQTEQGGDNLHYILAASRFNAYMHETFGAPTAKLDGVDVEDKVGILQFLRGKTGIYTIVNKSPGTAGYTGHVDMIRNGAIIGGANINPPGGILKIEIWELQ